MKHLRLTAAFGPAPLLIVDLANRYRCTGPARDLNRRHTIRFGTFPWR